MSVSKTGILLADLHFGAISPEQSTVETQEILYYIGKYKEKIDFIVFLGDLFDHKMYANDPSIKALETFISRVASIARSRHMKIRMVYGTESHECNQYGVLSALEHDPELDFRIIHTAEEEELFDGLHALYLPEEYITDRKSEYYKEFFSKKNHYDYIFGHGVITEVMTMVTREKSDEMARSKCAKFTTADFKKCCRGKVYFGHYHVHSNIGDEVYYVGSYSRWKHGEEEAKGFMTITVDGDHFSDEFIENSCAVKYRTIKIGEDNYIFRGESNIVEGVRYLDKLIAASPDDHFRFIFAIPENYPNPEFFTGYIREHYRMNKFVDANFGEGTRGGVSSAKRNGSDGETDKYGYVVDKKEDVGSIVSKFIEDKKGKYISPTDVTMYLMQDIQDIISSANEI